jgi:hypothetical protein
MPAQVRSTDAIEALSAALARFAQRVQNSLDALDGELHRADDWIEHDRPGHWRRAVHAAETGVTDAKVELERCLMMTTADGQRPACREQKAALEAAKARLAYCREKAEKVRHWQRSFRHEMFEYDGRIGQLRAVLDQQTPAARAVLERILRRLEEYRIERPPESRTLEGAEAAAAPPLTQPTNPTVASSPEPTTDPSSPET